MTTEPSKSRLTGTCMRCGATLIGDGDVAQRLQSGQLICIVCFLDPVRMREAFDAAGLFDMTKVEHLLAETRQTFDKFRGQEIRRLAKRDATKGGL